MTDRLELMFKQLSETPLVAPTGRSARDRGRQRRHRALARNVGVALAAAAVAAVAIAPSTVLGPPNPSGGNQPGAGGGIAAPRLVAAGQVTPSFPFTPSYLPAGLTQSPRLSHDPGGRYYLAAWDPGRPRTDGLESGLSVTTNDRPINDMQAEERGVPITVLGRPGIYRAQSHSISWTDASGTWLRVDGFSDGTHDYGSRVELLRVAEGLHRIQLSGPELFRFALVPAGFHLLEFSDSAPIGPSVTLGAGTSTPQPQQSVAPPGSCLACNQVGDAAAVQITALRAVKETDSRAVTVSVGKRSGRLVKAAGMYDLIVPISATTRLQILAPAAAWTEENLLRFAAGVTYAGPTPYGEPAGIVWHPLPSSTEHQTSGSPIRWMETRGSIAWKEGSIRWKANYRQ